MDADDVRRPVALMEAMQRLPRDRPFTCAEAVARAVSKRALGALVRDGLLARPLHGVYQCATLPQTVELRIAALALVVPEWCVLTDLTAAWVWRGDRVLAPGAHVGLPALSVFCPPGYRLRHSLVDSGERRFGPMDVVEVGGRRVTTPLRTACDVGRLEHRDLAIGVMDALAALDSFTLDELAEESARFKGFRGVRQLRFLTELVDPRSDSVSEAALRLRWIEGGLPRPECQVQVPNGRGGFFYVDIGLPEPRLGAEYFGERYHGAERSQHDEARLAHLRGEQGWRIVVARSENVYGPSQDVIGALIQAARAQGVLR